MNGTAIDAIIAASRCFGGQTIGGWTLDLAVTLPLLLSAVLYAAGTWRLWRRAGGGHGVSYVQAALFTGGWLAMAAALMSPLHDLSRRFFTAHMIEHEIMMAVAAPLLVMSRPIGAMLWAPPQSWRRSLGAGARQPTFAAIWGFITLPLVATVLHGAAIWIWHKPSLFEDALRIEGVHWLQHFGFFATALLFWWAMLDAPARRGGYGASVGHLFVTALHTGFLGILLTFTPRLWYPPMPDAALWGLTPIEDQQIAGLIMWIPAGLVYAGAALALSASWIGRSSETPALPGLRKAY